MATAGPNSPTSGTSSGTPGWTGPGNILVSDDVKTTNSLSVSQTSGTLIASGFGFAIDSGATINGITVEIENQSSAASSVRDATVQLRKGGINTGSNKASASYWPTTDAYTTYGGVADLWGASWVPAEINDTTFGVAIQAINDNASNRTARVDHVRVTITYTAGSGASGALRLLLTGVG